MDEPEPMPAFTFNPDGPTTISHPDGTVSVHAPQADDSTATTAPGPAVSVTATPAADTSSTTFPPESPEPPESPDPQPELTSTVPEPSGDTGQPDTGPTVAKAAAADTPGINEPPGWGEAPADTAASNSVVNPDGTITTRLPDGSTQTIARLPSGATIVTKTTPPGAYSEPAPPDPPRSRGWRRRGR